MPGRVRAFGRSISEAAPPRKARGLLVFGGSFRMVPVACTLSGVVWGLRKDRTARLLSVNRGSV